MSIELGKFNTLRVVKEVDFGMYLDGGEEERFCFRRVMCPKSASREMS